MLLIWAAAACGGSTSPHLATARGKLQHLVFIMQENRSFDTYFGTYPGADGIPMRNGVPILGDLLSEFDFSQHPLPPLVLPERPAPGPASLPGT